MFCITLPETIQMLAPEKRCPSQKDMLSEKTIHFQVRIISFEERRGPSQSNMEPKQNPSVEPLENG